MTTELNRLRSIPLVEVIAIAMLLLALMPHNPYVYYNILRITICFISIYLVFRSYKQGMKQWMFPFVITAVIYNPLIRVTLTRNTWSLINIATIILFIIEIVVIKNKEKSKLVYDKNASYTEETNQQHELLRNTQRSRQQEQRFDSNADHHLIKLASRLSGNPIGDKSRKIDELIAGLRSEQFRLGKRKYVVMLEQRDYAHDGFQETVMLIDSFNTKNDASACVDVKAQELLDARTTHIDKDGNHWKMVLSGEIPTLIKPFPNCPIHTIYDKAYKLEADLYKSQYIRFRAIGPFDNFIIGDTLFDFINQPRLLWGYFLRVGESLKGDQSSQRLK